MTSDIRFIYNGVIRITAMEQSIDEQIKALQAKKKEANRSEARANLVRVVGSKSSTPEQLLSACYTFIGTHRLNSAGRKRKVEPVVSQ